MTSIMLRREALHERCEVTKNDVVSTEVITLNVTSGNVITKPSSPSTSFPSSFDVSGNRQEYRREAQGRTDPQ